MENIYIQMSKKPWSIITSYAGPQQTVSVERAENGEIVGIHIKGKILNIEHVTPTPAPTRLTRKRTVKVLKSKDLNRSRWK